MSTVTEINPTDELVDATGVGLKATPTWLRLLQKSGVFWAFVLLLVISVLTSDNFLQQANLVNVARQVALVGIVGLGMTFVILTAGIDLSVGSIVAVSSVVSAKLLADGSPVWLVIAAGIAVGLVCGLTNGIVIANLAIPPFIMTLGMFAIARGVALTIADGRPISIGDGADEIRWLGRGDWFGLPVPVWLLLGLALISAFVLRYTSYGRAVYALGASREAARLAGINTKAVEASVYAISGALAGLTALILMSRLTIGSPTEGTGLELNAIAITVIGGTSLFGGEGGVGGTLIGAGIIAVLANLLNLLGVSPFTQEILEGVILVAAVMLGVLQRRRRA